MSAEEVFNRVRLQNLKRRYNKLKEHPELTDEAIKTKKQIKELESAMT